MTPTYESLERAWRSLRGMRGLTVREVACVNAPRTMLLAELGSDRPHIVSISAGVHGDEPASPWALYAAVRDGLLDERFGYRLWPCTNPTGYRAGTRESVDGLDLNRTFGRGGTSPEARAIVTANRDRRFALSLDLHEDHEAVGLYVYEPLGEGAQPRLAAPVVAAIAEAGFPIQDLADEAFDLGSPPEARAIQHITPGSVISDARAESAFFAERLPLSLLMARRAAAAVLTIETPRGRPWDDRIAMHRIALVTAIARAGEATFGAN
jgi:hypothetical protein